MLQENTSLCLFKMRIENKFQMFPKNNMFPKSADFHKWSLYQRGSNPFTPKTKGSPLKNIVVGNCFFFCEPAYFQVLLLLVLGRVTPQKQRRNVQNPDMAFHEILIG